jgi:hypothetical protein
MTFHAFQDDLTAMPITYPQFESLTNELLEAINKFADPHFLEANYFSQIVMNTIHAYDHKIGFVKKSELLESCINRVSCHVTYAAVAEIQKKQNMQPDEESDDGLAENVVPITSDH